MVKAKDIDEVLGLRKTVVEVRRENDGSLYSQVRKDPEILDGGGVVIDRVKGRTLTIETVVHRAKKLAEILGLEFVENYEWPCRATRKMPCRCPDCLKCGRA